MRDFDVRLALLEQLQERFALDPDTRIIEELGICQGSVRIDLAVANCVLHGYEIKSAADTLQRLPAQAAAYSKIFDHVTVVTASCHLEPTLQIVPSWWGVLRAIDHRGDVCLEVVRPADQNPCIDVYVLAQLLWRDEVLALLKQYGHSKGVKSKPREFLWKRLSEILPPVDLQQQVRDHLKARESWRVAAPPL